MAKIFNKQTRVVCGSFVPCGVDNSPCRSCRVAWNNTPCRSCVPSVVRACRLWLIRAVWRE